MPVLFHFDWYVDQHGYGEVLHDRKEPKAGDRRGAILARGIEGEHIRGKGGPLRAYRPLEEFPGLHRRFAELPKDTAHIVEFVHFFGLLGYGFTEPWLGEEDLPYWFNAIDSFGRLIYLIDAGRRDVACELFNEYIHPRLSARIELQSGKRPQAQIVPTTLVGAMYIQVLNELTNALSFKNCKSCPNWFSYGPGTGRRETKEFCSDRCRVAWNRKTKRLAASGG